MSKVPWTLPGLRGYNWSLSLHLQALPCLNSTRAEPLLTHGPCGQSQTPLSTAAVSRACHTAFPRFRHTAVWALRDLADRSHGPEIHRGPLAKLCLGTHGAACNLSPVLAAWPQAPLSPPHRAGSPSCTAEAGSQLTGRKHATCAFAGQGQGQSPGSSLALGLAEQEKGDLHSAWVI